MSHLAWQEESPHNGSRISGEPLLKSSGESTQAGASRHELPYLEREARKIEGGGARDGLVQGSSVCIRLLCGGHVVAGYGEKLASAARANCPDSVGGA
jgi:hypothetical protein